MNRTLCKPMILITRESSVEVVKLRKDPMKKICSKIAGGKNKKEIGRQDKIINIEAVLKPALTLSCKKNKQCG